MIPHRKMESVNHYKGFKEDEDQSDDEDEVSSDVDDDSETRHRRKKRRLRKIKRNKSQKLDGPESMRFMYRKHTLSSTDKIKFER